VTAKAPAPGGRSAAPSRRLRLLNGVLRRVAKPRLARTSGPLVARAEFERAARWLFPRPPHLLHLVDPAPGPPLHWISAGPVARRGVLLYCHGGAYFAGSPETHAGLVGRLSRAAGLRAVVPAYRLAPEHPAPAALEDVRATHARLLALGHAPDEIVLAGDSAGGGLALALLAELCANGRRPAGLVAFSPWTDLALTGPSFSANAARDPLLPRSRAEEAVAEVAGALRPDDPRLSPLYARFAAPPPALLMAGETEILRDDAVRMAARLRGAGGEVALRIWPEVPHAWPLFGGLIPEADAALAEAGAFAQARLASGPQRTVVPRPQRAS